MRSSTSNSDRVGAIHFTLDHTDNKKKQNKYFGWGLIGLLAIVILAEAFVFRNVMFYGYSPGFIGQLAELEATFQEVDASKIKAIVLGDSQSMDALVPELMAEHSARYDLEELFNFSISGGSAFDIYKTYLSYKDRLPNIDKAIVVVNEHQFNNEDPANYILFKYYANLRDRLQVIGTDNYGELLLGWALKSYDMRTVWTMMIDKYRKDELRDAVPVHEGRGLPAVRWSPSSDRTLEHAEETAERWFRNFKLEGVRTDAFRKLIRELAEDGVDTVILQLPRSAYFEEAVSTMFKEEQLAIRQMIQTVADEHGAEFVIMSNEGMTIEEHFRDTNHVNPEGAALISRMVAKEYLDR